MFNMLKGMVEPFKEQLKKEAINSIKGLIVTTIVSCAKTVATKLGEKLMKKFKNVCKRHEFNQGDFYTPAYA